MASIQNFITETKWQECIDKSRMMLKTENKVKEYILKAHLNLCHCNMKVRFLTVLFYKIMFCLN